MAHSSDELGKSNHIRMLLLGPPKSGKTTMVIGSSPGPVRVILCEDDSALTPAKRITKFSFDRAKDWDSMQTAVLAAKRDAKAGDIKTVVVDPLSTFGSNLEDQWLEATRDDGRRAYPRILRQLRQLTYQLFAIPAHVVVVSHYVDVGGGDVQPDGGGEPIPKMGEGIAPLLPGKARVIIPSLFTDVCWFEVRRGKRVLVTGPQGAWGPGSRSLKQNHELPADVYGEKKNVGIRRFIKMVRLENEKLNEPESVSSS